MRDKKNDMQPVSIRYKIRDKFPEKEFSKRDKQRVAAGISRQLNLQNEKDGSDMH